MYHIKVADFGLSQLLPDGNVGIDKQDMRGTPLWNAPEVLQRMVSHARALYVFLCL